MADLLVGKDHIDALPSIALRWGSYFDEGMSWPAEDPESTEHITYREINGRDDPLVLDDIGTMLLLENTRSLTYRYGSAPEITPYTYHAVHASWIDNPAMCFRPIDAYIYYSSEHPTWSHSEALRFCEALEQSLIIRLPDYEKGPWIYRRS